MHGHRCSVPDQHGVQNAVDKLSLLTPEQAAAILDLMRRQLRGGKRLHAFFSTLYNCGPQPEESVACAWKT